MRKHNSLSYYLTIPNCLTCFRLVGSIGLLAVAPLSGRFFILYTLTGVTDVLDGCVARATNSTSDFGAKLDSVSDLVFYAVMLLRLFPTLWVMLPKAIWVLVLTVIVLRLGSYLTAAIKFRRFAAVHTFGNKLTGALVFLIPYFLLTPVYTVCCTLVCVIGLLSSGEELLIHITSAAYNPHQKSLFFHR